MLFCPYCGTLLSLERGSNTPHFRYCCPTCRFVSPVRSQQTVECHVETGANGGKFGHLLNDTELMIVDEKTGCKTQVRCASADCGGQEAYFVQMQLRSADEPPTTFYECTKCKTRWKTD